MSIEGPLYAFTLPNKLLDSLQLRQGSLIAQVESTDQPAQREAEASTSLGCNLCKVSTFQSVANQRLHFRSDWHRYNLHLTGAGSKRNVSPLTEEQFLARAEADGLFTQTNNN